MTPPGPRTLIFFAVLLCLGGALYWRARNVHMAALPCAENGALRPVNSLYCVLQRQYVTPSAKASLVDVAGKMARMAPGARVQFMEASWPFDVRPMPPHLSHGDGREVDLALYYTDRKGQPLPKPPTFTGYGAFEPPRTELERVCVGERTGDADPPATRTWKLDEDRTRTLLALLVADTRVKRIFIEPHLKDRLWLGHVDKIRFAGCQAARHDDHIHVDFF